MKKADKSLNTMLLVKIADSKYRLYVHSPAPIYGFQFDVSGGLLEQLWVDKRFEYAPWAEDGAFVIDLDGDPFPGRGILCQLDMSGVDGPVMLSNMIFVTYGGEEIDTLPNSITEGI